MNSTAVLNRPTYKVPSPSVSNVSGATEYDKILRSLFDLSQNSTIVTLTESISINNKLQIQRVKDLAKLELNWDGDNAIKISHVSINNAISLIESLNDLNVEVYFSAPGPNSDIMIQLKNDNKEIEFIMYPNKSKFVLFCKNDLVKQGNFEFEELPKLIDWLNCE